MPKELSLKILSGNSNHKLAEEICEYLFVPLCKAEVSSFSDGETFVQINENIRGADTFIIQSTCPPANQNLMELLIMIDAVRRSSARRITAVIPYYGYGRQDRKVQPRVPITSKLVANLITTAGARRILSMDFHAGQIQGFFDIPVDHLYAAPAIADYFKKREIKDLVIVSPDAGGVERARDFAKRLKASIAIIDKRRPEINKSEVMNVIGDIKNKNLIILDDIIDTGGTIAKSVIALRDKGAKDIYVACTHPVFSGKAMETLSKVGINEVVITNTIFFEKEAPEGLKIVELSVAKLLGEAINRIHIDASVSSLFT
ncbi:ribose-phosphate pyrophosphokinase [bacterium]|nr:ribose-phosphate pyrophosphokinase [bacterium]MBU1153127.1 ribose-phosphate pyrophosphokinase [bacterium]MBU1781928.1 ribose-phosphate pyrophosphokinase [bacterium]MBU2599210.1 ribose-phosphate pyrophosphokinase [bacterium]